MRTSKIPRRAQHGLAAAASTLLAIALVSTGASPTAVASSKPKPPQPGTIMTVAGGLGDGKPAGESALSTPGQLTFDAAGNLYTTDANTLHRVRKISSTGIVTTVAGSGFLGFDGDGRSAAQARLRQPYGAVALDSRGNLFVSDQVNGRVRKLDKRTGTITTIAGNGNYSGADPLPGDPPCPQNPGQPADGDGGPAIKACLRFPTGLAFDASGNLYVAEFAGQRVRRIDQRGIISTVVGNGTDGMSSGCGEGRLATEECLRFPSSVAFDPAGNLYVGDNFRVRRVDVLTNIITTVAGGGHRPSGGSCADDVGDGGPAKEACVYRAGQVAFDAAGNIIIADGGNQRVRKVDAITKIISTISGTGEQARYGESPGDGGPATKALLSDPNGVALDGSGRIYVAELGNNRIRRIETDGTITTFAGNGYRAFSGDGGSGTAADLYAVAGAAFDKAGTLYFADQANHRVRRVDPSGVITTVAGSYILGYYSGDGGPAVDARLAAPSDVAIDADGNLYIADTFNCRIRKVNMKTGVITTVAGIGAGYQHGATQLGPAYLEYQPGCGYTGDGGPAQLAQLNAPMGVALDNAGDLFIAEWGNCTVRKVDHLTGAITTVAGAPITATKPCGFAGDGGPATQARLSRVTDVEVDKSGDLFIADGGLWDDSGNNRVRKVNAATGVITTVAGTSEYGFSGDGGPATQAGLRVPSKLAIDPAGNLYIGDFANTRVRKVDASGVITTVAGNGTWGFSGDGGLAIDAALGAVNGIAIDRAGNLVVAETGAVSGWDYPNRAPSRLRKVSLVAAPAP